MKIWILVPPKVRVLLDFYDSNCILKNEPLNIFFDIKKYILLFTVKILENLESYKDENKNHSIPPPRVNHY